MERMSESMTLKKSFFLIVSAAAVIVIILSAVSVRTCSGVHDRITLSHAFMAGGTVMPGGTLIRQEDGRYLMIMETGENFAGEDSPEYTRSELLLCRAMEVLMILLPVLFSLSGIGCAGAFFYRIKLKKPLQELRRGIEHMADSDLDFAIDCRQQDELGRLCGAFEAMRRELVENNRRMWSLLEERRKINASISHDLRTPITVIKGYGEFLERNAGREALTAEGTRAIALYIRQAAERLEQYANSVREVQALEDMVLEYRETSFQHFEEELRSQLAVMAGQSGKEISVFSKLPEQTAIFSEAAVFRMMENITANALRYCREKIEVELSFSAPFLVIAITDDGQGFSGKELAEATDFFYRGKTSKEHFGLGLSICRILAEKHEGMILLENAPGKGARVIVKIKVKN